MEWCPVCEQELSGSERYCPNCGTRLSAFRERRPNLELEDLSAGFAGFASYGPRLLPREILSTGEELVYETRPLLWLRVIPPLVFLFIPAALLFIAAQPYALAALPSPATPLGLAAITGSKYLGLASLAIALAWLGKRWLEWRYTIYAITTRRIICQTGIIGKEYIDCSLRRVQAVYVHIPFWGRIFDFGTVMIATAATAGVEIVWPGVKGPRCVQRILGELIELLPQPAGTYPRQEEDRAT